MGWSERSDLLDGEVTMASGYLALVLHAHLPFVRHPEAPHYLEEEWFFEAVTETYIPLLLAFERLCADDIDFRLTLSLSPTLLAMLTDDLLKLRYARKLDQLLELADRECERTWHHDRAFHDLAKMYRHRFDEVRHLWRRYDGDLVRAFRNLQDAGKLEIITCTATHAFLPLLDRNWAAFRAQIHTAATTYERLFGRRTQGMWLAECGYVPGVDELLREEGIRYFFVDTHGLLFAEPQPLHGVHAPVYCPTGVAAFGRDFESSKQVWSAKEGYPGDRIYRDFYRDIGFDLPLDYIAPYIQPDGLRVFTGFKYFAITHAQLHDKRPYDPHAAFERAAEHAGNFMFNREKQVEHLHAQLGRKPIVVAPYDAELFGHWWYEGPLFLELLFRKLQYDQDTVAPITPSGYLAEYPTNQVATPCASSWGYRGYSEFWCDGANAWIYRHLHKLGERMVELAHRFAQPSSLQRRALNQAARELMLAQSSDWAFIMKTGTTVPYAHKRTVDHVVRFNRIYDGLVGSGAVDAAFLAEAERRDNLFPDVDYRVYAT
jgi:1,4-alpha-glucan branching enzyme